MHCQIARKRFKKILSSSAFIAYFMQREKTSAKRIDSKNKKDTMTSKHILKLMLERNLFQKKLSSAFVISSKQLLMNYR